VWELLRAKSGGRWTGARDGNGIFPFAFTAGNGTFNVADNAQRFMNQGAAALSHRLPGEGWQGGRTPRDGREKACWVKKAS
jgi:hypothetical protein